MLTPCKNVQQTQHKPADKVWCLRMQHIHTLLYLLQCLQRFCICHQWLCCWIFQLSKYKINYTVNVLWMSAANVMHIHLQQWLTQTQIFVLSLYHQHNSSHHNWTYNNQSKCVTCLQVYTLSAPFAYLLHLEDEIKLSLVAMHVIKTNT